MRGSKVAWGLALSAVAVVLGAQGCSSGGEQCIRAVNCVKQCGGAVVQSGCSACPSGTFDDIQCDAGPQCFRAIDCVERCGGPVVASGCTCPSGAFDRLTCGDAGDAGGDAGDAGGDASKDAPADG